MQKRELRTLRASVDGAVQQFAVHTLGGVMTPAQQRTEDGMTPLEPGMAVTTEIKTRKRTVISYLLSPLLRLKHVGLKEK